MDALTAKRYSLLDKAVHGDAPHVIINRERLDIQESKNGMRFVTWDDKTFIQQDPKRNTQYGRMARDHRITRIMRSSGQRWGLMIDGNVEIE